jgi:DUF438 domain-containing protein
MDKTLPEEVLPIIQKFNELFKEFIDNAKSWKNTKNKHFLVISILKSDETKECLNKIIEIAERTNNKELKIRANSMKNDIETAKKMYGVIT